LVIVGTASQRINERSLLPLLKSRTGTAPSGGEGDHWSCQWGKKLATGDHNLNCPGAAKLVLIRPAPVKWSSAEPAAVFLENGGLDSLPTLASLSAPTLPSIPTCEGILAHSTTLPCLSSTLMQGRVRDYGTLCILPSPDPPTSGRSCTSSIDVGRVSTDGNLSRACV